MNVKGQTDVGRDDIIRFLMKIINDKETNSLQSKEDYLRSLKTFETNSRRKKIKHKRALHLIYDALSFGPSVEIQRPRVYLYDELLRMMGVHFWPRYQSSMLYGFPGIGKSYSRKKFIRDSAYVLDTDDIAEGIFGDKSWSMWQVQEGLRNARLNEMMFLINGLFTDQKPVILTNLNSPMFIALAERMGYTIGAMTISKSRWKSQIERRMGKTVQKWHPKMEEWFDGMMSAIRNGHFGDYHFKIDDIRKYMRTPEPIMQGGGLMLMEYVRRIFPKNRTIGNMPSADFMLVAGVVGDRDPDYRRERIFSRGTSRYVKTTNLGDLTIVDSVGFYLNYARYGKQMYRLLDLMALYYNGLDPTEKEGEHWEYRKHGKIGCNLARTHPDILNTFVITSEVPYPNLSLWFNSQATYGRVCTIALWKILGNDYTKVKDLRRAAIQQLAQNYNWGYELYTDEDIVGSITMPKIGKLMGSGFDFLAPIAGRKMLLTPSGHIFNLLLYNQMLNVDWKRYMDTIENNAKMHSGIISEDEIMLHGKGLFAERGSIFPLKNNDRTLWHNYLEWVVGVIAYLLIVRLFNIDKVNPFIPYVYQRLKNIARKYPSFNDNSGAVLARTGRKFGRRVPFTFDTT